MKNMQRGGARTAALVLAVMIGAGCSSFGTSPRLEKYRPAVRPGEGLPGVYAAAATGASATGGATNSAMSERVRRLRIGDRVTISKLGITPPEEIRDVVDDHGCVNLSLIGTIKIEGMTPSEAEQAIEKAYIDQHFYRQITVLVVAEQDAYFVRGEVRQPGKYPLNSGTTLLRAITTAGGYTDFANPRKINIFRADKVFRYNAERIEALKEEDPLIQPDDIIVVERRWFG